MSCKFVLRSGDIVSGYIGGTVNGSGTQVKFNRINWRLVMGDDMFNKYNKFAIQIEGITATGTLAYSTAPDANAVVSLGGLPFVNGCNGGISGQYFPMYSFATFGLIGNVLPQWPNYGPAIFYKCESSPLEIIMHRVLDGAVVGFTTTVKMVYVFYVIGVE